MSRLDYVLFGTKKLLEAQDLGSWDATEAKLLKDCHPKQLQLVLDTNRRIVARVPRRGGKTTAVTVRGLRIIKRVQDGRFLYIATTRDQAKDLLWEPLKALNDRLKLGLVFNETSLVCRDPKTNGTIKLVGADDVREIEKQRGKKFHEVWVDEAASHKAQLLEALIDRIIGPALADFGGLLGMIGTPGHILAGTFFQASRPGSDIARPYDRRDEPEFEGWDLWSFHTWTLEDNDRVHRVSCAPDCARNHLWDEALRNKKANGWSDQHPVWRREWLGEWAADDTENVYKYRAYLEDGTPWNSWTDAKKIAGATVPASFDTNRRGNPFGLPEGHDWSFVAGMDLGHSDPFALEIFAYSTTCKDVYHVYEFSAKAMYAKRIAELVLGQDLNHEKPSGVFLWTGWPDGLVGDLAGLGDAFIEELQSVYGITVEPAEKKNKHDSIELWNGDLIDGRVKLIRGSLLEQEQTSLQWAVDEYGKLKEHKGQANHCSDAAIYARRKAGHLFAQDPPPPRPTKGTAEAANLEMAESEERLAREGLDDFFGPDDFTEFFPRSFR